MKVECGADTFYNNDRWICPKEMKNWIDLQINSNNSLFVDFIIFPRNQ